MTNPNFGSERTTVVSPTDAKQGNRKRMNLRVLLGSLIGITLLGAILLFVFFKATPPGMDATPTGAETPPVTAPDAPAAPATEAAPPATTPPATPPTATEPAPAPAAPNEPAPTPAPAP